MPRLAIPADLARNTVCVIVIQNMSETPIVFAEGQCELSLSYSLGKLVFLL